MPLYWIGKVIHSLTTKFLEFWSRPLQIKIFLLFSVITLKIASLSRMLEYREPDLLSINFGGDNMGMS